MKERELQHVKRKASEALVKTPVDIPAGASKCGASAVQTEARSLFGLANCMINLFYIGIFNLIIRILVTIISR